MTAPAPASAPAGDPCRLLAWDTAHWGFPVARVTEERLAPADLPAIDAWCARHAVRCLMLLLPCDDSASHAAAHAAGFAHVDTRLEYACRRADRADASPPFPMAMDMVMPTATRPAVAADLAALRDIAASSHGDSRFLFDCNFPAPRGRALFAEWIDRDFRDPDGAILVSGPEGAPGGYVTLTLTPGAREAAIGLLAVAECGRRRGIGASLAAAALAWSGERGAERVAVVTQARNVAAQALYQQAGFRVRSCASWFHRWTAEPGEDRR